MLRANKLYIIITVIAFFCAVLKGGGLFYYIFYSMLFIFFISFIYMAAVKHFIDAQVKIRETIAVSGARTECLNIVTTNGILPVPYIVVNCSSSDFCSENRNGYAGNITIWENIWIKNEIIFYHRGFLNLGEITVEISDIFNIFKLEKIIDTGTYLKVYPKIYESKKCDSGGIDIYRERIDIKSNIEDQFTIKDVRKYSEGDSLKKIHWKLSAKYGDLLVKNQDYIYGEEFSIFLDMNRDNLKYDKSGEIEELVVDTAVSLINNMVNKNIQANIFINAAVSMKFHIKDKNDFKNFLEYIILQKSDGEKGFAQYIQENCYKLHAMNRVVVISPCIDGSLKDNILNIKGSGYNFLVIYCIEELTGPENISSLREKGIKCSNCGELLDIKKVG